jgi:hypothetical protein
MTDPRRAKDDKPRRAEPLQPDNPGRGRHAEADTDAGTDKEASRRAARQQEEQHDEAFDNVRKGYD